MQLSTVMVCGLALLLLTLFMPTATQSPDIRRLVKRADTGCTDKDGTCQNDKNWCAGGYVSGLCDGPTSRRCCLPDDSACEAKAGTCQYDDNHCAGGYESGLCDGPTSRRCCLPDTDSDPNCAARSGTCQDDSITCNIGCYTSGLCSGPASRRCCGCCTPHSATGETACNSETARDYACQLLEKADSGELGLWDKHPSGVVDDAFAYNNIRDACNGSPSARSSYPCSSCSSPGAPGGKVCLNIKVLLYILTLQQDLGYIHVNEIAGACHSCCSQHYKGGAVDLHNKPSSLSAPMLGLCAAIGGWGQDEGSHVHCQFRDLEA